MSDVTHPWPRLAELIRGVYDQPGESLRTIEARAKGGIGRTEIDNLIKGKGTPDKWPLTVPKLKALALGLGVPWPVVRDLVSLDTGAIEERPDDVDAVISAVLRDPHLLPEAKDHIVELYQLLLKLPAETSASAAVAAAMAAEDERDRTTLAELSQGVGIVHPVAGTTARRRRK